MGRIGLWFIVGLLSALGPLGAQEAPPADDPGSMAPGGEPGGEAQPQAPQKVRQVFVAPFINDGGQALAFWAEGLTVIFAEEAQAKFAVTRVDTDPALHADFVTGKLRATNDGDLRRAMETAGGDTILVTRYSGEPAQFKISGEAFEGGAPGEAFAKVEVSGQSPYVAVRQYLEAWAPKLGSAPPAAAQAGDPGSGAVPGAEGAPAMEGAPPMEGASQMPAGGGSAAMPAEGGSGWRARRARWGWPRRRRRPSRSWTTKIEHYCGGWRRGRCWTRGYTWLGDLRPGDRRVRAAAHRRAILRTRLHRRGAGAGRGRAGQPRCGIQRAWKSAVDRRRPSSAISRGSGKRRAGPRTP